MARINTNINSRKLANNITNPADATLRLIQQNFNLRNATFSDIVRNLEKAATTFEPGIYSRSQIEYQQRKKAKELLDKLNKITLLKDFNKYKKFYNLTDKIQSSIGIGDLSSSGILGVYRVSDEIIYDINNARDWIESYKDFEKQYQRLNNINYINKITKAEFDKATHEELLLLGQSILGRAIERTPIDTGNLRKSGILIDNGDSVTIAFTAPYASYVHENLNANHPWHMDSKGMQRNCGGEAKFLEKTLQEFFPNRNVWVEVHGHQGVSATISLNPLFVKYLHYN